MAGAGARVNAPIEMKPFYADGSRQLELVTDFGWIPFANLIDLKDDITEVFAQSDRMEEERMKAIAKAVDKRVEALREMAQGRG